jgi:L-fuconolactonase
VTGLKSGLIDAHFHLWKIGQNGCVWPTADLESIYQDFNLADIQSLATDVGVTGAVLVQSQEDDRDTDYLLELAESSSFIQAVVGWVDFLSPGVMQRIEYLSKNSKFKGLRPMLQAIPEDDWILNSALKNAFYAMLQHGLSFDALIQPRHLVHIVELAKRYPRLPIVIDHAAKPGITEALPDTWCRDMESLASFRNVHCKISGLVTEASAQQSPEMLISYIQFLLSIFGPQRLIWGSDWPVIRLAEGNMAMDYAQWLAFVRKAFAGLSTDELEAVFSRNAAAFYRIS